MTLPLDHTLSLRNMPEGKGKGTHYYVLQTTTSSITLRFFVTTSFTPQDKFVFKTRFVLKQVFCKVGCKPC